MELKLGQTVIEQEYNVNSDYKVCYTIDIIKENSIVMVQQGQFNSKTIKKYLINDIKIDTAERFYYTIEEIKENKMPEIINWSEEECGKRSYLGWVTLRAMMAYVEKTGKDIKDCFPNWDSEKVEMKLTIQGVEVPVKETFEYIESIDHERIEWEAKKQLKEELSVFHEEFSDVQDMLNDLSEELSNKLMKKFGYTSEDFR